MTAVLPGHARPTLTDVEGFDIQIGRREGQWINWRPLGSYMEAEFDWFWNIPGTFSFRLHPDHPMIPYLRDCRRKVIHIRTWENGLPWDGRIMRARLTGRPGREVVTFSGVSNLYWIYRGLAWVNNILPPEVQINLTGKQDVDFGYPDPLFKRYLAKVMTRLRKPVFGGLPVRLDGPELPPLEDVNTLDDLLGLVASSHDPIIVLQARFPYLNELYDQEVNRLELGMGCNLWSGPEDGPSPHVFNTTSLSQLQSILDYSSSNFLNFANPGNVLGLTDPSTWGTMQSAGYVFNTYAKRDRRNIQWRTDGGQIEEYDFDTTHADAHRVVVGGRAPEILNQVIEWAANFAIQLLINALLPGLGLGATVGSLFDNIFFAYQQFWDAELEAELGPDGFGEVFGDNTAAWSLDSYAVGMSELKKHGGSEELNLKVIAGGPDGKGLTFGADNGTSRRFQVGDVHVFWDRGTTVEQYVSGVKVAHKRGEGKRQIVTLGQDKRLKGQWERLIDHIQRGAALSRGVANNR